jgi:hypothetical protein
MSKVSIIGANFLDRFRSSDYKNSIYAIAEILDNSVDAEAKNIELITITKDKKIKEIFFVDDGKGMSEEVLKRCVVFSEGTNVSGSKKTGFFGMGLPNSSLSQCRDFSVICKINDVYRQNRVDFKKMQRNQELFIDDVFDADEQLIKSIKSYSKIKNFNTVVHWADLDKIDTLYAGTLKDRIERLMGRIHRYSIRNGIKISILNYSDGNLKPDINHEIIENDPLFLTTNNQWIIPVLSDKKNLDAVVTTDPLTSTRHYYSKFIDPNDANKLVIPLFYSPENACEKITINYQGSEYIINMTVAVAYKDIQKPGIRNGGTTPLGKQFGIKIKGTGNYPSANISWVRNNREITVGNYSLFNVTAPEMRFWSIELNYATDDSENRNLIDELLGLSNSKQHLKFIPDIDLPEDTSANAAFDEKKQELMAKITIALNEGIRKATDILGRQAREWSSTEKLIHGTPGGSKIPGPTQKTYDVLIDALGKGQVMTTQEKEDLVKKIRKHLTSLDRKSVEEGVEIYSKIGIENVIIYCELDERDLFQSERSFGKDITLINTKHSFYLKVLEPLKEKGESDILASIELLLSSLSRSGHTNFKDEQLDTIKDFYTATAKDLKRILSKTPALEINSKRAETDKLDTLTSDE